MGGEVRSTVELMEENYRNEEKHRSGIEKRKRYQRNKNEIKVIKISKNMLNNKLLKRIFTGGTKAWYNCFNIAEREITCMCCAEAVHEIAGGLPRSFGPPCFAGKSIWTGRQSRPAAVTL